MEHQWAPSLIKGQKCIDNNSADWKVPNRARYRCNGKNQEVWGGESRHSINQLPSDMISFPLHCIIPCSHQALPSTGILVQPWAIVVCLQLICCDSTGSPGIFTVLVIQSCQLMQLQSNVSDGFMAKAMTLWPTDGKAGAFEISLVNGARGFCFTVRQLWSLAAAYLRVK